MSEKIEKDIWTIIEDWNVEEWCKAYAYALKKSGLFKKIKTYRGRMSEEMDEISPCIIDFSLEELSKYFDCEEACAKKSKTFSEYKKCVEDCEFEVTNYLTRGSISINEEGFIDVSDIPFHADFIRYIWYSSKEFEKILDKYGCSGSYGVPYHIHDELNKKYPGLPSVAFTSVDKCFIENWLNAVKELIEKQREYLSKFMKR
jgi:hypothetical protein